MPDTKIVKQTAADGLQAAHENERRAKEAHDKAAGAVRAALATKNALIESAASGAAVTAADVRAAEEAARSAEIDSALAEQVHAGAVTLRHKAQLAEWYAEAERLREAVKTAAQALHAADAEIDRLAEPLRQAIREYSDRLADLEAARRAAAIFNTERDARKKLNPVLAEQDSGIGDPVIPEAIRGGVHPWPAAKRVDGYDIAQRVGLPVTRAGWQ